MKKKKLVGIALGLALVSAITFAGCGGKTEQQEDPLADGKLSFGVEDSYVPLEFRDDNNKTVGFDIDLGDAIGKELGVEVEWVSTAWDGIFNGLNAKQYDAVLSGTSITEERKEGFNMTDPYITNGIVIVSRKDGTQATKAEDLKGKTIGVQIETTADIAAEAMKTKQGVDMTINKFDSILDAFAALEGKSIDYIVVDERKDGTQATKAEDLKGKTIGVQIETTADIAAEAMKTKQGVDMTINKFDSILDAFAALEGKSIDYIVVDEPVAAFYTAKKPDVYGISSEILSNEPIGITIRKTDTEFCTTINDTLKKLREDGTMKTLSEKWFGKDITENINTDIKTIE